MPRYAAAVCCLALLIPASETQAALPTLDEIAAKVTKAAEDAKTFSADTSTKVVKGDTTAEITGVQIGKFEMKGEKRVFLLCATHSVKASTADGHQTVREDKTICDGEYRWREIKEEGKTTVIKYRQDSKGELGIPVVGPDREFRDVLMAVFTLRVTGEDTVDGAKVLVVEGAFNDAYLEKNPEAEPARETMASVRILLDAKTLCLRRVTFTDAAGTGTITIDVTNVKTGIPVDEKLFVYSPPEGAEVIDKTKLED